MRRFLSYRSGAVSGVAPDPDRRLRRTEEEVRPDHCLGRGHSRLRIDGAGGRVGFRCNDHEGA